MSLWRTLYRQPRLTGLVLVGGLSLACGTAPPPSYSEVQGLLNVSCTFSACHGTTKAGNLSLVAADSYCNLVGGRDGATFLSTAKDGFPRRVVAGDRAKSFLYRKLTLTSAESGSSKPLGEVMPQNQPLDAKSIDLFARWIDGGAPNLAGQSAPGGCP